MGKVANIQLKVIITWPTGQLGPYCFFFPFLGIRLYNGLYIFLSGVLKCIFFTDESSHALEIPQANLDLENQPHNDDVNIEVDFLLVSVLKFLS
jgi:hypothetical protein